MKNQERRRIRRRVNAWRDRLEQLEREIAEVDSSDDDQGSSAASSDEEIIDAEVIEIVDLCKGSTVENCASSLPAVIPKTIGAQNDSNHHDELDTASNSDEPQHDSDTDDPNEYVNPYPYLSLDWWEHCTPTEKLSRCRATNTDGSRCRQKAIQGGRVCRQHGGLAPHVKLAARNRIENAADQMAEQLLRMAIDPKTKDSVKLAAIRDALDRAGLKAPEQVVVSAGQSSAFEDIAQDVGYSGISHAQPGYVETERTGSIDSQGYSDPFGPAKSDPLGSSRSSSESNSGQYQHDSSIWNEGTAFNDPGSSRQSHTAPVDEFGAGQRVGTDSDCDGLAARRTASREHWDRQYRRTDHVTGDDAIEAANAANREAGALKALPPGRKRT
ncbi:hypothetical protein [Mycobacteroides abscessus]|uniref:hypothetical protein n=1 Tax=Mycobacteroides abscessus TaxID=36809 RepID=UPI0009272565|nr:hypothetical protein [Mycobacteroides abscessus]SIL69902.1 Uncharacterised protein [Mycobacteroides abscessus subsp. abscessus]SIM05701.1 Uncharacterised protein [Mycobacteroides abscessus subsp. abscessus]SLI24487.1 Uncharacterised protein [Mycobacteroides abscessus subsp. abscessus]